MTKIKQFCITAYQTHDCEEDCKHKKIMWADDVLPVLVNAEARVAESERMRLSGLGIALAIASALIVLWLVKNYA